MSLFMDRTIPPGDRDEAPPARHPSQPDAPAPPVAGRKPDEKEAVLPALALTLDQVGKQLDEMQMALGDTRLAQGQGDWALLESSAHKLSGLAAHVARTITECRSRNGRQKPKE